MLNVSGFAALSRTWFLLRGGSASWACLGPMAVKFFYSSNPRYGMRLLEYKGKDLLYKYGVEKPRGMVISSPDQIGQGLKYPVFVKAQVPPFAGRAKMGARQEGQ